MKHLFAALLCFLAVTITSCAQHDTPIEFSQLPQAAQEFCNQHFAGSDILMIVYDSEIGDKDYKVMYTSGAEVKFNKEGAWKSVEFEKGSIPEDIIPENILKTIKEKYANGSITKISKERKTIEVEINDRIELIFNKSGKFLRYDD